MGLFDVLTTGRKALKEWSPIFKIRDILFSSERKREMSKVIKCRDIGMQCDFVARGETEQEVLAKAGMHAKNDHGMTEIPPEVMEKVKAAVHDE